MLLCVGFKHWYFSRNKYKNIFKIEPYLNKKVSLYPSLSTQYLRVESHMSNQIIKQVFSFHFKTVIICHQLYFQLYIKLFIFILLLINMFYYFTQNHAVACVENQSNFYIAFKSVIYANSIYKTERKSWDQNSNLDAQIQKCVFGIFGRNISVVSWRWAFETSQIKGDPCLTYLSVGTVV